MSSESEKIDPKTGDHIFRFRIDPSTETMGSTEDIFHELIRRNLEIIIQQVILMNEDSDVQVDSFRFMNESKEKKIYIFKKTAKDTLQAADL
jgi:hypothetical protein